MIQKIFRFDYPLLQSVTYFVTARSEGEARALLSAYQDGDVGAKRSVELRPPSLAVDPFSERMRSALAGSEEEARLRAIRVTATADGIKLEAESCDS